MGYVDTFKNSFALDVLEALNIVKINEYVNAIDYNSYQNSVKENVDLEVASQSNSNTSGSISQKEDPNEVVEEEEKDPFLVDWNGDDDVDHPYNWSTGKKTLMIIQIMLLTTVTYMGSSIYTPGQEYIQKEFGVGHVAATLNLSLYVLGYGIGPVFLSPLSEFALLGRQQIYIITLFLFTIFQIGAATVNTFGGLVVIRFISGFLCSPALATGGGSVADIVKPELVPVFIGLWSVGAVAAPVLAPLLGATMVVAEDWRWIFWLLCWVCTAALILFIFFFPETHHGNILHRRAKRLRAITGDDRYYTKQVRIEKKLDKKEFIITALYKPIKIIMQEPIVLAFNSYLALCYGVFYLFFEAFPLVFVGIYDFSLIEVGLAYMGFQVGCVISYPIFLVFMAKYLAPKFKNNTFKPEDFLVLAMGVCWALPLSIFLFGWTAGVHWILPIISEIFFVINTFNLFQVTFAYFAVCYPEHLASVFAGNSLFRAGFACAFPLFGQTMYQNLATKNYPVAWGSTILGFISIAMGTIPFFIYKYGPLLRSKSRYSA